jgi:hypothetical protein
MSAFASGGGDEEVPVIFFDNEDRNCDDMKSNVKNCASVCVDDKSKPDEYSSGNDYMEKQAIAGNIYAIITRKELGPEPHICKGITDEIILKQLTPWIEKTQGDENRFAVFDWDRTISVVEGLAIPRGFPYRGIEEDKFIADITSYVLGGKFRIQMLIHMFQNILEKDIEIVILTNNPSALQNTKQRETFLKMIKIIIPQFNPDNLLCSFRSPSKSIRFNEYLASLDLLRGGGKKKQRKTKCKKNKKTRRNTKRRRQKHH